MLLRSKFPFIPSRREPRNYFGTSDSDILVTNICTTHTNSLTVFPNSHGKPQFWINVQHASDASRPRIRLETIQLALPNGNIKAEPKSISWDKMEQGDFEKLYSDALDVILAEFLDNWTTADMETAINEMLTFT